MLASEIPAIPNLWIFVQPRDRNPAEIQEFWCPRGLQRSMTKQGIPRGPMAFRRGPMDTPSDNFSQTPPCPTTPSSHSFEPLEAPMGERTRPSPARGLGSSDSLHCVILKRAGFSTRNTPPLYRQINREHRIPVGQPSQPSSHLPAGVTFPLSMRNSPYLLPIEGTRRLSSAKPPLPSFPPDAPVSFEEATAVACLQKVDGGGKVT